MPTKNTETASFRLDSENLEKLKKEAEENELSLNQLLNQIINNHVNFRSVAKSAGFMPMPKPVLMNIMDKLSEEEAKKIGEDHFNKDVESILCMLRNDYDVDTFLDTIEYWVKDSGFSLRHDVENDIHKYVIQHNIGKNWSWYMAEFISRTIEKMTERKVISRITDNSVAFSVDKSKVIEN
jgi:predicted DNA-binding protein